MSEAPTREACALNYLSDLDQAVARGVSDVTPDEFDLIAEAAGWHPKVINIFLTPPLFLKPVLIGKIAYRLLDVAGT